jgi:probable HAF family extracellular repeat protein
MSQFARTRKRLRPNQGGLAVIRIAWAGFLVTVFCVLTVVIAPSLTAAAAPSFVPPKYSVTDLGTFGGPDGHVLNLNGVGQHGEISPAGAVVGFSDTVKKDPYCFIEDCHVTRASIWKGRLVDLGGLPGGGSSEAQWISTSGGWIAGVSLPAKSPWAVAVAWRNGTKPKMFKIGTFGGPAGSAYAINNSGQVAGEALNSTPDPASPFLKLELRAFLWSKGKMTDLGTLMHGRDVSARFINNKGMIAGWSYTDSKVNKLTHSPTQVPFAWKSGKMIGLGSLGGSAGYPTDINDGGHIVGQSDLKGDKAFRPFVWSAKTRMQGLPTFGGASGSAAMINENGVVVGWANTRAKCPGCWVPQVPRAALWRNGKVTNLGVLPGLVCSGATGINASGQVVGSSSGDTCPFPYRAMLWESGHLMDLNNLIQPSDENPSLYSAEAINDAGDIVARGTIPAGDTGCSDGDGSGYCFRIYLLKPIK